MSTQRGHYPGNSGLATDFLVGLLAMRAGGRPLYSELSNHCVISGFANQAPCLIDCLVAKWPWVKSPYPSKRANPH